MFSFLNKTEKKSNFPWKTFNSIDELKDLLSSNKSFFLFKHSTRCIVSKTVKSRFESMVGDSKTELFIINVIEERPLSNYIAETTGITHQSPQALLFDNGNCIFQDSHDSILNDRLVNLLKK